MIKKSILNALLLSLIISSMPTLAHAGWFASFRNYFSQPTKNSLVITTAIAGISFVTAAAAAVCWWKAHKALAASATTLNATKMRHHGEQLVIQQRLNNARTAHAELVDQNKKLQEEAALKQGDYIKLSLSNNDNFQKVTALEMQNESLKQELTKSQDLLRRYNQQYE